MKLRKNGHLDREASRKADRMVRQMKRGAALSSDFSGGSSASGNYVCYDRAQAAVTAPVTMLSTPVYRHWYYRNNPYYTEGDTDRTGVGWSQSNQPREATREDQAEFNNTFTFPNSDVWAMAVLRLPSLRIRNRATTGSYWLWDYDDFIANTNEVTTEQLDLTRLWIDYFLYYSNDGMFSPFSDRALGMYRYNGSIGGTTYQDANVPYSGAAATGAGPIICNSSETTDVSGLTLRGIRLFYDFSVRCKAGGDGYYGWVVDGAVEVALYNVTQLHQSLPFGVSSSSSSST